MGLSQNEIQHIVDRELLHSGHIDTTAQMLAATPPSLVLLGGEPGIGKTHAADSYLADRFIHVQYDVDFDRFYDIPRFVPDAHYIGERRVNKGRKIKDRNRNRAARKARRAGR